MTNSKRLPLMAKKAALGFQHMFAMLGATITVPILANMSIAMAMIAAGVGTIIFYFITKRKVPVFLGSSFAFLPALIAVVGYGTQEDPKEMYGAAWQESVAAVAVALVLAGLVYVIFALVIKFVGVQKVRKLFPAIVVGPVVLVIGMILAPKAFQSNIIGAGFEPWKSWTTAIVTALAMVLVNAYAKPKSFLKVIPVLMGFAVGYVYAILISFLPGGSIMSYMVSDAAGNFSHFDFSLAFSADRIIIFQHIAEEFSFYLGFSSPTFGTTLVSAILMIVPLAIVTFMEHLGDISANSTICGKDFMVDPGLHRTVMGDGIATAVSGLLGGPANTTYGENTAVLAITKNYDPKNIFLAAVLAIIFGMLTVFADFLASIPAPVIGGASIVLYGMISASGLRTLVDSKVDFNNTKNLIVVSVTLAIGLGMGAMSLIGDVTGETMYKVMIGDVEISPLAIATVVAILLNLVIPDSKEQTPEQEEAEDNAFVNLAPSAADIELDKLAEENIKQEEARIAAENASEHVEEDAPPEGEHKN